MKTIGLMILFFVPTVAGFIKSQSYIESRNILRGFISLIIFIKHEITSYLTPQQEIYEKFYDKSLEKSGFLLALRNVGGDAPFALALKETRDKLFLSEEAFELLYEFGTSFGTLSEKEEALKCEKLIRELEEIYKAQKEETNEKTRLCRTVGCMTGIALVLLMW